MIADKTTLQDLAIFHAEEEQSVFNTLNYAQTSGGRHWLMHLLANPFHELKPILETQQLLRLVLKHRHQWPQRITNGTIMVIEKYFQSQVDAIPRHPGTVGALSYKLLHGPDYSLTRYTVEHAIDFMQGMQEFVDMFSNEELPSLLHTILQRIQMLLNRAEAKEMLAVKNKKEINSPDWLRFGFFLLNQYKMQVNELIDLHGKLDAYYSMATAIEILGLQFPNIHNTKEPHITATKLYHILLSDPVSYELQLNRNTNFIFLTGANMAGKSTFIKAVGIAVYLAHIGMAVPAASMELSMFDGVLSNIQVADNIIKGESYFFNEVQRIKNTIIRINDGRKWLVLIDELFKGTNVQDAMRCSATVIKGLLKISNSLFILSTHLYEIGEELKVYPNIAFRFFETHVTAEELHFSYQLQEGISNDRLGYLILKREGVVDMIENL